MTLDPQALQPPVTPGMVRCFVHGDQWAYSRQPDGKVVADPTGACGACLREILSKDFIGCGQHGIQPKSASGGCPVCEKAEEIEAVVSGARAAPAFDLNAKLAPGFPEGPPTPAGPVAPEFAMPGAAGAQAAAPVTPAPDVPPPPEPSPEQREEREIDPSTPPMAGVEPYSGRLGGGKK